MKNKTILLKISGASLVGKDLIISTQNIKEISLEIKKLTNTNNVGIVCGGGNIWRGEIGKDLGMNGSVSDNIGMLATMINSLVLAENLNNIECETKVFSALSCSKIMNDFTHHDVNEWFSKPGRVAIFAGGTGLPYFTTDTCAALRAIEIKADKVLIGKNGVDGVYSSDPLHDSKAEHYENLSYDEIIKKDLKVMDQTAISLCKENDIELVIFNINDIKNISKVINNECKSTIIKNK